MYRYTILLLAAGLLAGCDVINNLVPDAPGGDMDPEIGSPALRPFTSSEDLLGYFRGEIAARNDRVDRDVAPGLEGVTSEALDGTAAPVAPGAQQDGSAGADASLANQDFSQTTTQESGVEEADVVKTDGTHLYMISGGRMRIVRVDPPELPALVGEVELDGFGRALYLDGRMVIAMSEEFGHSGFGFQRPELVDVLVDDLVAVELPDAPGERGDAFPIAFARPRVNVTMIDVSDPADPQVRSRTRFDGSLASSRMIDGSLYLVIANYQRFFQDVIPLLGRPELDVEQVDLEMLLPDFERIDADGTRTVGDLLTWEDLYRPTDADGFGLVAVVSMVPRDGAAFDSIGIVAQPGLIYSSRDALYLTDTNFDLLENSRRNTDVYKFAYEDGRAAPVATGVVPGRILNQYSMSEFNGFLRVATTVRPNGVSDGLFIAPHNNVYVLGQEGDALNVVGSVEGIAPRETIQSARFIGDRGYVVTFEQVDPLFTLDLSDPTDPQVVGELKVPGFSTFIVPMDEDHLLTVGQFIPDDGLFFRPWGVQLSIFDVSDFASPSLAHSVILGEETGAFSEALYDPKAFTYFAESGLVALPVSVFEQGPIFFEGPVDDVGFGESDDGVAPVDVPSADADAGDTDVAGPPVLIAEPPVVIDPLPGDIDIGPGAPVVRGGFDGLVVYRVSADLGFSELARISTRFEQAGFFGGSYTRGVFVGDSVFAATDIGIRGGSVDPADDARYELFLGPTFDDGDVVSPDIGPVVVTAIQE